MCLYFIANLLYQSLMDHNLETPRTRNDFEQEVHGLFFDILSMSLLITKTLF